MSNPLPIYQSYIDGAFSAGDNLIEVFNPANGERLGSVPETSLSEVERAIAAARTAQKAWAKKPANERAGYLRRIASKVRDNAERLARMEDKPAFAEAVARKPEEGVAWQRAASQRIVGKFMAFVGVGFLALYAIFGGPDYDLVSFNLLCGVVMVHACPQTGKARL